MARIKKYRPDAMRTEPLDENELALFARLKQMDGKQLAKRLPAWARPATPPARFEFKRNQAPVYPSWTNRPTTVAWVDADRRIPGETNDVADYVRRFESLNNLKAAA